MKFIHIADVHLGARPDAGSAYSEERGRELWDTFEHVLNICREEEVDLLLIAGDLFHRQPLLRELKEVDYLFSELPRTKVVLMAGNHDYIRRDSYYRTFQWGENVFPLFGQSLEYVEFPELQTAVYGLSYHAREIREPLYDDAQPLGIQPCEILLAHGGDEKHIPFDRSALAASGFSYIAMGHIHKPGAVEKNHIIYAGALEPIDRNDVGPHGYVKGTFQGGRVHIQWLPCAQREYVHLEVPVDETDTNGSLKKKIENIINEQRNENIYKIILRGRRDLDIVFETERMGQAGNIVEVVDETAPAYDLKKLMRENAGNLLGRYIEQFSDCEEGSVEYLALYEGVEALLKNKGRKI